MAKEMHFPDGWDDFGPKMKSLSERERKFCWAYLTLAMANGGHVNGADAAREAGYSDIAGGARVRAHELMQRERVIEALDELGQRELRGLVVPAMMALRRLLDSPLHVDHPKAIMAVLNRTGYSEKTEHSVNIRHSVDTKELEDFARRLAAESGIDPVRLLGGNPKVIEGEIVNGTKASADADQEDR